MTTNQTAVGTPFTELVPDDAGDYTLNIDIDIARQDDRRGPNGHWAPDRLESFSGAYAIAAGRKAGRWFLFVTPTIINRFGDIENAGPPVVDLRDQTAGPDPLTLLRALLTGTAP